MAHMESTRKKNLKFRSLSSLLDTKSCEKVASCVKLELPVKNSCKKRKAGLALDGEKRKRRRMDPVVKNQCGAILDALISHPNGRIFRNPVDSVALNIPDYFSIISNPMDLSTIKSKLASDRYLTPEEFASDIRLTFSNAMLYNPLINPVHHMAKFLDSMFLRRWKLLEAKWKHGTANSQHKMVSSGSENSAQYTKVACCKKSQQLLSGGVEKNTQDSERAFCKKSRDLISSGVEKNTKDSTKACYKKSQGLVSSGTEKDIADYRKTSQGLKSSGIKKITQCNKSDFSPGLVVKSSMSSEEKLKLKKYLTGMLKRKMSGKLQTLLKKFGFFDSREDKIDLAIDALDDETLMKLKRVLKSPPHASSAKDSGSNILSTQTKNQDCNSKIFSNHASKSNLDSGCILSTECSGNDVNKDNTCLNSRTSKAVTTAEFSGEDMSSLVDDEQAAVKKALRVEMLKSRYADIISKANGDKTKAEQGMERRERQQHEEHTLKARIKDAQVKKEAELRSLIEEQRKAARNALEMLERTVQLDDSMTSFKELQMLSRCCATYIYHRSGPEMVFRSIDTGHVVKPLEQLGLHIKDKFMTDDEVECSPSYEAEEGEILE